MPKKKIIGMPRKVKTIYVPKNKNTIGDDGELPRDRISQLPDDILVSIIGSLTLKEVGRTSVLSNRWRYLWTSHGRLNFDASYSSQSLYNPDKLPFDEEKRLYVDWVNRVVPSYKGSNIDQFMVQFGLDRTYSKHMDEWVEFALKMNVRHLTLDLERYSRTITDDERYNFPDIVERFHREHVSRNLTSLRLIQVNVSDEVLCCLLANCHLLECLVVHNSASLSSLEARGVASLTSLEVCFCFEMKRITVDAPNLQSLVYNGPRITMELNYVPKLVKMSLGDDCSNYFTRHPLEFYSNVSQVDQVEVLVLGPVWFKKGVIANTFPVFANLKHLEVRIFSTDKSLLDYGSLIKSCPSLSKFSLKQEFFSPKRYVDRTKHVICPHYKLKVVEVMGFVGQASDVEFVSYLIENAVMLEEITLDTRSPIDIGNPWEFDETEEKAAARRQAEQLVKKLGHGVTWAII